MRLQAKYLENFTVQSLIGYSILALMLALTASNKASLADEKSWERDAQNLLTNFNNMYNPCVVEVSGSYRYRMWFFGWAADHTNRNFPGCDAIFHARSKDLKTWEVYSGANNWDTEMNPKKWIPVLHASQRWYEAWHVGDPSVVFHAGQFYMAYSATSKHFSERAGYPSTMVQCVMGAISKDGISWKKTEQPLLYLPSDTADPTPNASRIGDFHRPSLHRENDKWRLWFDYWVPGKGVCMGCAETSSAFEQPESFRFTHALDQPLIQNWPNPEVVRIGANYHCFADPPGYPIQKEDSSWKSRQLREAVSADGVHWKLLDFIPPDTDADACHVPQSIVTEINGEKWLYLFYATQVGYKKKDRNYHYEYDRIRAMRRKLSIER